MQGNDLTVGLMGPMITIGIEKREYVNTILQKIVLRAKNNYDEYLIINKLYKKYLNLNDVEIFLKIQFIKYIYDFNEEQVLVFNTILNTINRLYEQMLFMIENNENPRPLRLVIYNIPYLIYDQMQPLEFYDNLTDEDEPFWMRDVSDFIQK